MKKPRSYNQRLESLERERIHSRKLKAQVESVVRCNIDLVMRLERTQIVVNELLLRNLAPHAALPESELQKLFSIGNDTVQ